MLFFLALAGALSASLLQPFSVLTALLLLVAVALFSPVLRRWRPSGPVDLLLLAWLAWLPATLFWGMSIGLGLQWLGALLTLPLAYLAWRQAARNAWGERGLETVLWVLLLVLALWGILQGPETVTAKPQGPFNDPNAFAGVLALLSLPLFGHYLAGDQAAVPAWLRTLQLAVLGAAALTFFIIASRGAMLALLFALPPLIWVARARPGYPRKMALLLVVAGVSYGAAHWVTSGVQDNVLTRLATTLQSGDSTRVMLMRSALDMIADRPWLGWGLGSFRLLYPRYRAEYETDSGGGWVHNDYLQLWQEAGLPMLLVLLALAVWVGREIWRTGRGGKGDTGGLIRLGYLCGLLAIGIQAAMNFMIYFAFVGLISGVYLGRIRQGPEQERQGQPMPRAWRMVVGAYGLILAYLFAGYVAVDVLLERDSAALKKLVQVAPVSSRYEAAHWLSLFAPMHYAPQQVMGQELFNMLTFMQGEQLTRMLHEALDDMDASQRRIPCFLPYGSEALNVLTFYAAETSDYALGKRQMERNLACNPHHGLTHYLYGLLLEKSGDKAAALGFWQLGLPKMIDLPDRLLLAAAIMSRTTVGREERLKDVANKMAATLHWMEQHPDAPMDPHSWAEAQYQMLVADRAGFIRLTEPRKQ